MREERATFVPTACGETARSVCSWFVISIMFFPMITFGFKCVCVYSTGQKCGQSLRELRLKSCNFWQCFLTSRAYQAPCKGDNKGNKHLDMKNKMSRTEPSQMPIRRRWSLQCCGLSEPVARRQIMDPATHRTNQAVDNHTSRVSDRKSK